LNKQDQLNEGLHLIDFEQLKIENQSLNEKKAEKNQELVKIEDEIKINSPMLTRVKEKLAFVWKQKFAILPHKCNFCFWRQHGFTVIQSGMKILL
jgi:histone deacetylase 6